MAIRMKPKFTDAVTRECRVFRKPREAGGGIHSGTVPRQFSLIRFLIWGGEQQRRRAARGGGGYFWVIEIIFFLDIGIDGCNLKLLKTL